jgi:hypothetical protein
MYSPFFKSDFRCSLYIALESEDRCQRRKGFRTIRVSFGKVLPLGLDDLFKQDYRTCMLPDSIERQRQIVLRCAGPRVVFSESPHPLRKNLLLKR